MRIFLALYDFIEGFEYLFGSIEIGALHVEACKGGDCFPVFGEADIHPKLLQMDKDGVVEPEGVAVSPGDVIVHLGVYFLAPLCYFFNELPPVVLKIIRFEYTIVNELDCLLDAANWPCLAPILLRLLH